MCHYTNAVFYIVWDHLYGEGDPKSVDHLETPSKIVAETEEIIGFHGNSEFLRMVAEWKHPAFGQSWTS